MLSAETDRVRPRPCAGVHKLWRGSAPTRLPWPGSALTASVLLRPAVPVDRFGWLSLLGGLADVDPDADHGRRAAAGRRLRQQVGQYAGHLAVPAPAEQLPSVRLG